MKNIQMVDLLGQYQRIKSEIDIAIFNVIETTSFINGPEVNLLAEELANYNNVKHVIPCANGTDALQLAMMALGLQIGDEVIVPAFTYVATVEVIALLGLMPVFVDVDPETFLISINEIEKNVNAKTKAIVPVHLFGQCADMEAIMKIAKKNDLFVIEDTAQAIGANYTFKNGTEKKAGTIGDIGTTSFFPSKNLGCYGDGGALLVNDDELALKLKMIANHGQQKKYYHDVIGVNSRLDTLQAAILRIKLKNLDDYSSKRNFSANFYDAELSNLIAIKTPKRAENTNHVFHQYTLICNGFNREELQRYLQHNNIPSMVYYPIPLHLQKAYSSYGYKKGNLPISESLAQQVLSLPIHTEQDETQLSYITSHVKEFLNQKNLK